MLRFPSAVKVFLCIEPADLRKSFDRLAVLVRDLLHEDPLSGHVFVFRNRRGDRLKLLYWDRDGFALWYKRLEKGTFVIPKVPGVSGLLDPRQLSLMLEGVDLTSVHFQKRFQL
jgi:transposase